MVSLMGNMRYASSHWGSLPASDMSDVTYGQQVERLQQEEQYRQEMMRQRQELHRRQIDLYQRLQLPSQDIHNVVSTWRETDCSWQKPSAPPTFGVAPVVRNPSTYTSNKDVSSPLTVDCSVEYELPDFLKVSTGSGPPLLMKASQNQRSASSSVPENGTINESAKKPPLPTPNYWTNTKDSSAMLTQDSSGGRHREMEQKHSTKQPQLQQKPQKIQRKRKLLHADLQDGGGGTKRQKMMALTPPDLISASHALSTSSRWASLSSSSRWANLSSSTRWAGLMQQPPHSYSNRTIFPPATRTMFPEPTTTTTSLYPVHPTLFPRPDPMLYPISSSSSSSGSLFTNPLSLLQNSCNSRFDGQMFSGRMFPAGYDSMYSQYTQNPGCPACIQGICKRIY